MKKIFFTILILTNLSFTSFSQVVNIYKISPQHLTVNTFSLTLERASYALSRTSLNISPFVTYYDRQNYLNTSEKVAGAGLELGKKIYVSKVDSASPLKGFYASGSLTYGYYSADYQKTNDSSYTNPFNYHYLSYTSSGKNYHENIQKIGADVFIGYQFSIKKVFYIDAFFGAGMRYGISSLGDNSYYKASLIDIGHSGIIPKAGVKLGLRF
ncbi:MAG TPA: hypothetical protein VNW99_05095 [Cytophagaceae bacterium]|nr:hypothetical protein [Cytophagaceae bacterium]